MATPGNEGPSKVVKFLNEEAGMVATWKDEKAASSGALNHLIGSGAAGRSETAAQGAATLDVSTTDLMERPARRRLSDVEVDVIQRWLKPRRWELSTWGRVIRVARVLLGVLEAFLLYGVFVYAVQLVASWRSGFEIHRAQLATPAVYFASCVLLLFVRQYLQTRQVRGKLSFGYTMRSFRIERRLRSRQVWFRWVVIGGALLLLAAQLMRSRTVETDAFATNLAASAVVGSAASWVAALFAPRRARKSLLLGPGLQLAQVIEGRRIPDADFCIAMDRLAIGSTSHPSSRIYRNGNLDVGRLALAKAIYCASLEIAPIRDFLVWQLQLLTVEDVLQLNKLLTAPLDVMAELEAILMASSGELTEAEIMATVGASVSLANQIGRPQALVDGLSLAKIVSPPTANARDEALALLRSMIDHGFYEQPPVKSESFDWSIEEWPDLAVPACEGTAEWLWLRHQIRRLAPRKG
jgi:hypothetical protein